MCIHVLCEWRVVTLHLRLCFTLDFTQKYGAILPLQFCFSNKLSKILTYMYFSAFVHSRCRIFLSTFLILNCPVIKLCICVLKCCFCCCFKGTLPLIWTSKIWSISKSRWFLSRTLFLNPTSLALGQSSSQAFEKCVCSENTRRTCVQVEPTDLQIFTSTDQTQCIEPNSAPPEPSEGDMSRDLVRAGRLSEALWDFFQLTKIIHKLGKMHKILF